MPRSCFRINLQINVPAASSLLSSAVGRRDDRPMTYYANAPKHLWTKAKHDGGDETRVVAELQHTVGCFHLCHEDGRCLLTTTVVEQLLAATCANDVLDACDRRKRRASPGSSSGGCMHLNSAARAPRSGSCNTRARTS